MGLYLGSTKISAISFYKSGAITPSGIFNIPSNVSQSTYDVTSYAFANGDFGYGYGRLPERISGDISEYSNSTATNIATYAFAGLNISSISMPAVKSIGDYAFVDCTSLTSVNFPSCTSIGASAFANCSNLTYISFPACTFINGGAFVSCSNLISANFPMCSVVNNGAFSYCRALSTISLPLILSAPQYLFYGCYSLSSVNLLSCKNIQYGAFQNCSTLSLISLPNCSSIATYAFYGCYYLLSLYLMSTSVVSLAAITAFTNTPISNYTTSTGGVYGSIYVPASLLASYKAATNWTTFSDRIVGV